MGERERRVGENEARFRAFNDAVSDVVDRVGETDKADILCECGRDDCLERIAITRDEYEDVRSDPLRFVIKKGHVFPKVEIVVDENDRFYVIEKREGTAASIVREGDPQS